LLAVLVGFLHLGMSFLYR